MVPAGCRSRCVSSTLRRPQEQDGEAGPLPEFLADDEDQEKRQRRRSATTRRRRMTSHRGTASAVPPLLGGRRTAPVPFLLAEAERERRAGKGLSRRGPRRAPAVRPVPALPRHPAMTESLAGGAAAPAFDACRRNSRLRRRQGCATAFDRSRTRPSHRCRCPARRDGGCLRRLRCDRRLELEDRL